MFDFIKKVLFGQKNDPKTTNTNTSVTTATEPEMVYLIVGLGNIGNEYALTRHNVGFLAVDRLAAERELPFVTDRLGDVCEFRLKNKTVILLKPSTYMNLSGKAVKYWVEKRRVPLENVLIIVDELSLPFSKLRIRGNGSAGGHNGLKSLEEVLGTQNYARLRFGVSNEFSKGNQIDYVLGKWSDEEMQALPVALDAVGAAIKSFVLTGLSITMNLFNKK